VKTPTERAQEGLGIGLALVKQLVELHGGVISLKSSAPNEGSTFQVRLPIFA
jgi:signal transduction histidine kinase